VFEAGERRSARRSPRYRHRDGPRMGTVGGRRRKGGRRATTAADSARRQEGIGCLPPGDGLRLQAAFKAAQVCLIGCEDIDLPGFDQVRRVRHGDFHNLSVLPGRGNDGKGLGANATGGLVFQD
jgi:hypothetical protein